MADSSERETGTTKVSVVLTDPIRGALTREAEDLGRDLPEHLQRVLAEHVLRNKLIPDDEAQRLRKLWSMTERVGEEAKKICRDGGFTSGITLSAIHACMKDPAWVEDYRTWVKDDIYKHGNPLKKLINPGFGARVKAAIKGRVEKDDENKARTVKVAGEIIQSYTPMIGFDPKAVA